MHLLLLPQEAVSKMRADVLSMEQQLAAASSTADSLANDLAAARSREDALREQLAEAQTAAQTANTRLEEVSSLGVSRYASLPHTSTCTGSSGARQGPG